MARSPRTGPMPVDAIKHSAKRTNIPTADAHEFVDPTIEEVRKVRYARDESLDPQLVWRGKYALDEAREAGDNDLITDAPPIYIQEKIDPRVLIENLRRTAIKPGDEPELTLFDSFDGLDELDQVDFYKHDANWSNRMILGDSLQVMASLADREKLRGKVQMVYVDPPYGIKFNSNWQVSTRSRDVTDGKLADAAREAEQIKAFRDTWQFGIHSYLTYLRDRLLAARELLSDSGSCFVQIGDENLHLVRSLMDEVFGSENWITTIIVSKTSSATGDFIGGTVDYVHWFAKNKDLVKHRTLLRPKIGGGDGAGMYTRVQLSDGTRRAATADERRSPENLPDGARLFRHGDLTSQSMGREKGEGAASWFAVEFEGKTFRPSMQARWKTNESGMDRLLLAGRVAAGRSTLAYVRFLDDFPAFPYTEVWTDIGGARDKSYVVETAPTIVERCLLMSTDPGDLVLDPTCGSGTTAFVSEQWGRRWITVDTSRVALALARQRIMAARYPWYLLADSPEGYQKEQSLTAQVLPRQEFQQDVRQGFVYERVPHITLRSIANNPDIKAGMTRTEIDEAIRRHADFEPLYDRPYEDSKRVRVAGPLTVESLSPHRSLSFSDSAESISETEAAKDADGPNFEQSILDNLARAGIQNGRKNERITFDSFETYAGEYIQAVGEREGSTDNRAPQRVAIAIGPQYGTVSPSYVKKAAREAINADAVDLLAILGFAFDPQVTGLTEDDGVTIDATDDGFANVASVRKLGRIPVLMVRMNADLLMGEELKKTGAGNLFTVFGEPDVEIRETSVGYVVDLKGIDVYDPTTGAVRSADTEQIALWMVDTDYNEESFFVRHCYFTGGNDPYKRLKAALKAEIDSEAWESLYRRTSRPFAKPVTGKIAVKVINDYGDEVMQVFDIA